MPKGDIRESYNETDGTITWTKLSRCRRRLLISLHFQGRHRPSPPGPARAFFGVFVSPPGARRRPSPTAASLRRSNAAPSAPRLRSGERSRRRANIPEASSLRIVRSRMFLAFRRCRRLNETFAGGLARQHAREGDQRVGRRRLVLLGGCSATRSHADRLPKSADGARMAKSLSVLQRGALQHCARPAAPGVFGKFDL